MYHSDFDSDSYSLCAPIEKGPTPRWQRKAADRPTQTRDFGANLTNMASNTSLSKKSPGRASKTPTRNGLKPKTPKNTPSAGDRCIPNRAAMDFDASYFKLIHEDMSNNTEDQSETPSKAENQRRLKENMASGNENSRILTFKKKAVGAEGHLNDMKVLYSHTVTPASSAKKKNQRYISQTPERILDAPDFIDDYYLNLLHWGANGHLAVALGDSIYIWNSQTAEIMQLCQMDVPESYVASVKWVKEGSYLAVGTSEGIVQIWDVDQKKRLRQMPGHASRVGALSWNNFILSSGCRSGAIHHHDVRDPNHHVGTLSGHTQEVCGLEWSPDGQYLASGGNDNLLCIWGNGVNSTNRPLKLLTQHTAAVKAVAWCPWQSSVLASGGGTADRCIRFWNVTSGACLNTVDAKSQVCGIVWSEQYKEIMTGHGFTQNQLSIWKYPSMTKVMDLLGHSSRVLQLEQSPDGSCVMSAAADETLRLWRCWQPEEKKRAKKGNFNTQSSLSLSRIR